ncbi:hypothetical protein ACHAXS_009481 [Conticribra weissflogii]
MENLMEFKSTAASDATASSAVAFTPSVSSTVSAAVAVAAAATSGSIKTTTASNSTTTAAAAVSRSNSSTSLLPPSENNSEDYLASFAGNVERTTIIDGGSSSDTGALAKTAVKNNTTTYLCKTINETIPSSDIFDGDIQGNTITNSSEINNDTLAGNDTLSGSGIMANNPLLDCLLYQKVLADKLTHPVLTALSQSNQGRYILPILLATHLTFLLLIWIPLYLLSLLVTEIGIYLGIVTVIVHGGRCLLRLLAFPGTNVKVYGEMEMEFARYSCKMLEGGVEAIVEFCRAIKQLKNRQQQLNSQREQRKAEEWILGDLASCYKRVVVYRNRVFGVYWQVFGCLFEEDGKGIDPWGDNLDGSSSARSKKSGFYHQLEPTVAACKRNLCCDRNSGNGNGGAGCGKAAEGIQLGSHGSGSLCDDNNFGSDSYFDGSGDDRFIIPKTNRYGNNPLMGDIGNMANLTHGARSDGKALYTLLGALLDGLATLESSFAGILQISDVKVKSSTTPTVLSDDVIEQAKLLESRANELNALVSQMKPPSPSGSGADGGGDVENDDGNTNEEQLGADAVRHRLEEHGTSSTASSSSNALGVVKSAVVAFLNMIDPPPHKYIFGLDVIRGCFLSRYRGARQFWVDRISGSGKIDVIMIPSLLSSSRNGKQKDSYAVAGESILPLSPRQGRFAESGIDMSFNKTGIERDDSAPVMRKAVLYCNPNAGLAEVATGLGLIGGNVEQDENERSGKESTCWTEFYIEHGFDVYLFNYAGYGRSYGGNSWNNKMKEKFVHGWFGSLRRVFFSTFLAFKVCYSGSF